MKKTLREIAAEIGGEVIGDADIEIGSVNGIREAQEGDITFLANTLYRPLMNITKASAGWWRARANVLPKRTAYSALNTSRPFASTQAAVAVIESQSSIPISRRIINPAPHTESLRL